jgi:hypothetical protein
MSPEPGAGEREGDGSRRLKVKLSTYEMDGWI